MDLEKVSKDFAAYVQRCGLDYKIRDLAVYGSFARKCPNPNDLDFLIVHQNPAFESIEQTKHCTKGLPLFRQFTILNEELKAFGYPALDDLLSIPSCKDAIVAGKLRAVYLSTEFFENPDYAKEVVARNEDPKFFDNAFKDALLWDAKTGMFTIPFLNKYQEKINKSSRILIN